MNSKRINDIEILRAIAVLLVVVHHAQDHLFTWTSPALIYFYSYIGGGSGVDLFFTISGFVIARSLYPQISLTNSKSDFFAASLNFWIRRAWRLLPSAWLWILLPLLLTIFFNESDSFGSFRENYETALAAFFHVANFHFADTFGNRASGVTFVYWSLSLEEQFYLIFPFLILLSGKRLPYVLAMAIFLQLVIDRGFIMIVTRTDALCFGILIALWSQKESYTQFKPMFLVKKRLATIIFLLIMTLGLAAMDSNGIKLVGQDLKYSVIAVMSAILVFIASHNNDIFSSALGKLSKVIVWVGSRSYAIYLIHIPAFLLSREIWFRLSGHGTLFDEQFFYQYLITAFVLIVALAELNFRLVEQPLRRKGKHIADSYMKSQAHKKNQ